MMKNTLFASIKFLLVSTVLFGGLYTLLVTGIGQVFLPIKPTAVKSWKMERSKGLS